MGTIIMKLPCGQFRHLNKTIGICQDILAQKMSIDDPDELVSIAYC